MRVPREWVWVPFLIAALVILLLGCAPVQEVKDAAEANREAQKPNPWANKVDSIYLESGLYAFEFEGHLYLWEMSGFLLHAASCKGVHTLVGP